jgi:methylated-DNA-[protein]-cysteine S-methyltransferase
MQTHFRVLKTEHGWAGFTATDRGLRRSYLPTRTEAEMRRQIRRDCTDATESVRLLPEIADALERFYAGQPVDFDGIRFDWSGHSSFEIDVWRACKEIGYGHTGSYKSLAERLATPGGARAVGTAMSHNPFAPIVPCHRVLKSDGSLGGYSGPGGVLYKKRLLDMEAAATGALLHA